MHLYKMFKMKKDENINEMFTRFTLITNSFNSLRKTLSNAKKVQKVLRCLPRSKWRTWTYPRTWWKWHHTIHDDLRALLLDDLFGKLTNHELTFLDDGETHIILSMKNLALKEKKRKETSSENAKSHDEEDPFDLIARGLEGIMKIRKRFKKYKWKNNYKGKSSSSNKTNKLACFECGSTKHLMTYCPKN